MPPLFRFVLFTLFLGLTAPALAQEGASAVILQYHHVSTDTPPSTSLSEEDFRIHMEYLRDNGFAILPLERVLAALRAGDALPERAAVITFDDGYRSVYEVAWPLLREYGWPFTIFVTSGLVESNRELYATWDELREMGEAGATLANHTVSHPYMLQRLPGEDEAAWRERLSAEILDAEARIQRETGQSHRLLAYPYGEYDPAIQALVRELDFIGIGQQSGPINATSDFTALPRFPFSGIYVSMNTYPVKVNSLAFNLQEVLPPSPVTDQPSPAAELAFLPGPYDLARLACFNNDQPVSVEPVAERRYRVETQVVNTTRRFRYNCTAPGPGGRYFWYSIPWVNPAIAE